MPNSYNGYAVFSDNTGKTVRIGTDLVKVTVLKGPVATVLNYVFNALDQRVEKASLYNVNSDGVVYRTDEYGWYYRRNVNDADSWSCHASGTAFDYNATRHPNGVARTRNFTTSQITEIHKILKEVDYVVRWGGDYTRTVDAMHFEIIKPIADVTRVAERLESNPVDPPPVKPKMDLSNLLAAIKADKYSDLIKSLQMQLKLKGYDPGPIDGWWGDRTRSAVRGAQIELCDAVGDGADGIPGKMSLTALGFMVVE